MFASVVRELRAQAQKFCFIFAAPALARERWWFVALVFIGLVIVVVVDGSRCPSPHNWDDKEPANDESPRTFNRIPTKRPASLLSPPNNNNNHNHSNIMFCANNLCRRQGRLAAGVEIKPS